MRLLEKQAELRSLLSFPDTVITKFIDGDTVHCVANQAFYFLDTVIAASQEIVVRLAGIDTPEIHSQDPAVLAKALAARDWLKQQAQPSVLLMLEDRPDKYGRRLGELFVNGKSLNQQLLDLGMAVPYHGEKKG